MEKTKRPTTALKEAWINDPTLWKWGLFYYNPRDKRIFPPKRIKALGWTINFANPRSILMIPVIAAIIILISYIF